MGSVSVGDLDLYEIGDLPFVPDGIHAVQVTMCARKDDAATREVRSKVKSGATTANGAPHALTASYVYYRDMFETDPNTSASLDPGRRRRHPDRPGGGDLRWGTASP
jgi:hypothetical protein